MVQSIQATNDLDVHQALLTAPSYQNKVRESYYVDNYIQKALQDYKDNFGFVQVFACVCVCPCMRAERKCRRVHARVQWHMADKHARTGRKT